MRGGAGPAAGSDHAALMDRVYRGQRHIYDLTRKYYLLGRDELIAGLDCRPGDTVLEIACGTGRNLAKVARAWPGTELHGIDISREMLRSAERTLGDDAVLAAADACGFDPQEALGRAQFDRVILSYSLSMIPDWQRALEHAAGLLAPFGSLHVVDFGDLGGLPGPIAGAFRAWLARFHVAPRADLAPVTERIAAERALAVRHRRGRYGYWQHATLSRL
ncbi:class I SAM-dependent methyltransferase [Pelagerythrobacter marinus]|uniref:class I SAM-dependent methyltransferase n=1 Tax=Pelagerythrobacter marinus TaxID=538382 RepID=UPI002036FE90|nr:methyltransferase [Pelagerythrobacter marinus]USA40484.1 methyltransferase domain-containing protein [Pelagerythrobacter marinus]WPZ08346.1 methyltransferase domain-containing protein [Pelagerythrobacter marinus]